MSDFKNLIRTVSNDSENSKTVYIEQENNLLHSIAEQLVTHIKSQIQQCAEKGNYAIRNGKHHISDYCEFYYPAHAEGWIECSNIRKNTTTKGNELYFCWSKDLSGCFSYTCSGELGKLIQVDTEVLDYKKSEFFNYITWTKKLTISQQERVLRQYIKQLAEKDDIPISAYFLVTENINGWGVETQEIVDVETLTIHKPKNRSVSVRMIYKYEFEY